MDIRYYHVNAFASEPFRGNPAGVCCLTEWIDEDLMRKIARENALPETAFVVPQGPGRAGLRWFTPEIEMDLCGHATLATAYVMSLLDASVREIVFDSAGGELRAGVEGGLVTLRLPRREPVAAQAPGALLAAVGVRPVAVYKSRDYIFRYGSEAEIRNISVDVSALDSVDLGPGGLCVTAAGTGCDFVSRFFCPRSAILEDPVTGSAHCSLVPLWAGLLDKRELVARQLSERGGELLCADGADHVLIAGRAVVYTAGVLTV